MVTSDSQKCTCVMRTALKPNQETQSLGGVAVRYEGWPGKSGLQGKGLGFHPTGEHRDSSPFRTTTGTERPQSPQEAPLSACAGT